MGIIDDHVESPQQPVADDALPVVEKGKPRGINWLKVRDDIFKALTGKGYLAGAADTAFQVATQAAGDVGRDRQLRKVKIGAVAKSVQE